MFGVCVCCGTLKKTWKKTVCGFRNGSVCTFKTSPCVPAPRAHVFFDVLNAHTGTGPPGLPRDDPELQTCILEGPNTPPKFHEKTSRESTKSVISGGKRKKKKRNFGRPGGGGPARGSRAGYPAKGWVRGWVSGRGVSCGGASAQGGVRGRFEKMKNKYCEEIKKSKRGKIVKKKNEFFSFFVPF